MQWLIDIILELIQPLLDALKVTIHGQLGFFDRGDPAAVDFTTVNFTTDNAWHDLDLSGIVPANAQSVLFSVVLNDNFIARGFRIRKKGNINGINVCRLDLLIANIDHYADWTCPVNSDRLIEYRATAGAWNTIVLSVKGWWLR